MPRCAVPKVGAYALRAMLCTDFRWLHCAGISPGVPYAATCLHGEAPWPTRSCLSQRSGHLRSKRALRRFYLTGTLDIAHFRWCCHYRPRDGSGDDEILEEVKGRATPLRPICRHGGARMRRPAGQRFGPHGLGAPVKRPKHGCSAAFTQPDMSSNPG